MFEHTSEPEALTSRLLASVPSCWRMIPFGYNRKCNAVCERILSQRDLAVVHECWRNVPVDQGFLLEVCEFIVSHFFWSRPLFVPHDECFVLFRFWQRRVADCMEVESFVIDLESRLGSEIPLHLRAVSTTLGEFLCLLEGLRSL
jgi:hypothetical protein